MADALELLKTRLTKMHHRGHGKYMAQCPAHEDRGPSLSIKETDNGMILLHCFAGCDVGQICAAVNLEISDLFPPKEFIESRKFDQKKSRKNYKKCLFLAERNALFISALVGKIIQQKDWEKKIGISQDEAIILQGAVTQLREILDS